MIPLVADASVILKWYLPERGKEEDWEKALELHGHLQSARAELHQPAHWLAEVAAVLARLSPETAEADLEDLHAMSLKVLDSSDVYVRAARLSLELRHHLFDTLYHAVAFSVPEAVLVTADDRYFRKARSRGRIARLKDFTLS